MPPPVQFQSNSQLLNPSLFRWRLRLFPSRPYLLHQMNMMMFDMHADTAKHFYKEACPTGREMTKKTGIAELVPGAVVDDIAFDPCG